MQNVYFLEKRKDGKQKTVAYRRHDRAVNFLSTEFGVSPKIFSLFYFASVQNVLD